jgi:opacity protein-like surface antigen
MKPLITVSLFAGAILLAFGAAPAGATDLTLFGGAQSPGPFTLQTTGSTFTVNPRNFGVFGVRASVGTIIGSEQTFAYSPNFIDSNTRAFIFNGNLIVHVPLPRVRPYGTVGIGTVYIDAEGPSNFLDAISGARFAVNYGGGVKVGLAGPLGAQVDVRGYRVTGRNDSSFNMLETSLGIVLSF